jgi:hypothetical protein
VGRRRRPSTLRVAAPRTRMVSHRCSAVRRDAPHDRDRPKAPPAAIRPAARWCRNRPTPTPAQHETGPHPAPYVASARTERSHNCTTLTTPQLGSIAPTLQRLGYGSWRPPPRRRSSPQVDAARIACLGHFLVSLDPRRLRLTEVDELQLADCEPALAGFRLGARAAHLRTAREFVALVGASGSRGIDQARLGIGGARVHCPHEGPFASCPVEGRRLRLSPHP